MTPDQEQLLLAARLLSHADGLDRSDEYLSAQWAAEIADDLRKAAAMLEKPLMVFQTLPVKQWEDEDHGHGDVDRFRREFRERLYAKPPECPHEEVYYSAEKANFYCSECNIGMGCQFYADNYARREEFPGVFSAEPPCIGPGSEPTKTAQEIFDSAPHVVLTESQRKLMEEYLKTKAE